MATAKTNPYTREADEFIAPYNARVDEILKDQESDYFGDWPEEVLAAVNKVTEEAFQKAEELKNEDLIRRVEYWSEGIGQGTVCG